MPLLASGCDPEDEAPAGFVLPPLLPLDTLLRQRFRLLRVTAHHESGARYLAEDLEQASRLVQVRERVEVGSAQQRQRDADAFASCALLSSLAHPGLPAFYDRFSEGERHYLVLESIAGPDLEQSLIAQGNTPFAEARCLDWGLQLCEILQYLHGHAILHCDLKPANLVLAPGRIRILDFSCAQLAKGQARAGMRGTQGYAAPEQYRGQAEPRSDLYALAATLHQLLTGHAPEADPPFSHAPLRKLNPRVSAKTAKLIARVLEMDPSKRFHDAMDMHAALSQARRC